LLGSIYDHQVIANGIEIIEIPPREVAKNISNSYAMLVEDFIAKSLDSFEIPLTPRQADFEGTYRAKRRAGTCVELDGASGDGVLRYPLRWAIDLLPLGEISGVQFRTGNFIEPHLRL
jgi:hypothetical protein